MTIFQLFDATGKVPFAAVRSTWVGNYFTVVTKVLRSNRTEFGTAYGFPVEDGAPNNHYTEYDEWREKMEIPSAGCRNWVLIDVEDSELQTLCENFRQRLAPRYLFNFTEAEKAQIKKAQWKQTNRFEKSIDYLGHRVFVRRLDVKRYRIWLNSKAGQLVYSTEGEAKIAALCRIHRDLSRQTYGVKPCLLTNPLPPNRDCPGVTNRHRVTIDEGNL